MVAAMNLSELNVKSNTPGFTSMFSQLSKVVSFRSQIPCVYIQAILCSFRQHSMRMQVLNYFVSLCYATVILLWFI